MKIKLKPYIKIKFDSIMNIEITTNPNEADAKTISNGIVDFNNAKIPDLEPLEAEVKFFVFARNEDSKVIGGVRATCFWNTLHIELLWLSAAYRGKGIGKQLIDSTESFAKEQKCEKGICRNHKLASKTIL